ncbi:MAG: hypothetical protein K2X49_09630 [Acetobacteraceae bacterium]|nr:hypothetical protein [Acetobacteraceae bacterium]
MLLRGALAAGGLALLPAGRGARAQSFWEQRGETDEKRAFYNTAFFYRHNRAFRTGAALHFSHGYQHDVLELTPFADRARVDADTNRRSLEFLASPPRTEPAQEYYAPYTAQAYWRVLRIIDWTHKLHEMTYDIMSERRIPWPEKKRYLDDAVRHYLTAEEPGIARSIAPLDVTMRRAAVMMKPYFTTFRNHYPLSNNFFYYAHWWHPIIYEAMMVGGNGPGQEAMVAAVERVGREQVVRDRPLRMLLSREIMPRYAMLSPESANAFDNLHMLHGFAYDLLAYEGWTTEQKRAELYRWLDAMSYKPGDERYVRKFRVPNPDLDPRAYTPDVRSPQGEMSRIMMEMLEDMMPMMGMSGMAPDMHRRMMDAFRAKMTPGMEPGEHPGSLHDALMALMPGMRMMPGATEPGRTPAMMVDAMLRGWERRHGGIPDAPPMPMNHDPGTGA